MPTVPFMDPDVQRLPNGLEVRKGKFFVAHCRRADGTAYDAIVSDHYIYSMNNEVADKAAFHHAVNGADEIVSIAPAEGWAARHGACCWVSVEADPETAVVKADEDRTAKQPSDEAFRAAFPSLFPTGEA